VPERDDLAHRAVPSTACAVELSGVGAQQVAPVERIA
jgi:hypothetical protein